MLLKVQYMFSRISKSGNSSLTIPSSLSFFYFNTLLPIFYHSQLTTDEAERRITELQSESEKLLGKLEKLKSGTTLVTKEERYWNHISESDPNFFSDFKNLHFHVFHYTKEGGKFYEINTWCIYVCFTCTFNKKM